MMFIVEWDQWFRCGPNGDDAEFDSMSVNFDTLAQAEGFVDELVSGKFRSLGERPVNRSECKIIEKETKDATA
jgi:hypothetical protein